MVVAWLVGGSFVATALRQRKSHEKGSAAGHVALALYQRWYVGMRSRYEDVYSLELIIELMYPFSFGIGFLRVPSCANCSAGNECALRSFKETCVAMGVALYPVNAPGKEHGKERGVDR